MTTPDPPPLKSRLGLVPHFFCLGLPPCFLLALWRFPIFVHEPLRDASAAGIILAWQAAIAFRMFRQRQVETERCLENAFIAAMIQQAIILTLASLVLDVGQVFCYSLVAGMAYWMTAGLILSGRPATPTVGDVDVIRFAPFFILIPIMLVGPAMDGSLRVTGAADL